MIQNLTRTFAIKLFLVSFLLMSTPWAAAQPSSGLAYTPQELVELVNAPEGTINTKVLANEVLKAAKTRFTYQKVRYLDQGKVLIILPEGKAELNRLARKMQKHYNATVFFKPSDLMVWRGARTRSYVQYQVVGNELRTEYFIGIENVLLDQRHLRNTTILHEMRHMHLMANMAKRKPSPIYGNMTALRCKIPDEVAPQSVTYRGFLSFDEIVTFRGEAKYRLIDLKRKLRATGGVLDLTVDPDFEKLKTALFQTYSLSSRVVMGSKKLSETLASGSAEISYEWRNTVPTAIINIVPKKGCLIAMRVPLVAARNLEDPKNEGYIEQQTADLLRASTTIFGQAKQAITLINELEAGRNRSLDEKLALVDLAQASLPSTKP